MAVSAVQWGFTDGPVGVGAGDTPLAFKCINVASDTTFGVTVDESSSVQMGQVSNVVNLDPAMAMFEAMLAGWVNQQRARFLRESTIFPRVRLVRRFADFTGLYPWEWTPAEGEAWISSLRSGVDPVAMSTARSYEVEIGLFCEYLLDSRYNWVTACIDQHGRVPQRVFHDDNSIIHSAEYEGSPGRRPLTFDEVQQLFNAADDRVELIRSHGRKGALTALRDAAMLKFCYAFGLRRQEVAMCDVVDLRTNAKIPEFGRYGALAIRHGKASRGGAPKRRTVLTTPEMAWITGVLDHYLTEIRPSLLNGRRSTALWVSERGNRIDVRSVGLAFCAARDAANLESSLNLHSLRHSFVTHHVEFDYPERFIQEQVGHEFSSTTAVYVGVSNEYRNRLIARAMERRYGAVLGGPVAPGTPIRPVSHANEEDLR